MDFLQKYIITSRYLSKPSKRRSGQLITAGVKFVVAHDTGNPGSTAVGNVAYYENSRDTVTASAHLFVDDKSIIECIPALTAKPEKAWHVLYNVETDNHLFGCNANDAAIGVEYCYGGSINADEAYRKYIWTIALICYRFNLDPANSIVGHFFLDPQRKTDPVTGLAYSRRTYEQMLRDVVLEYQACTAMPADASIDAPSTDQTGSVVVTVKMNIRKGSPRRTADVVQEVQAGTVLDYVGVTSSGEAVNGNARWFKNANGDYFWSGATAPYTSPT